MSRPVPRLALTALLALASAAAAACPGREITHMVSQEAIPQMDASHLFYTTWGDPKATTQSGMMGSPLWKNLAAVKAGRAFAVDDDFWMTGTGILAANRVLDDLEKYLK